jgi:hypothetical protein
LIGLGSLSSDLAGWTEFLGEISRWLAIGIVLLGITLVAWMLTSSDGPQSREQRAGKERKAFKLRDTKFRGSGLKITDQDVAFDVERGETDVDDVEIT